MALPVDGSIFKIDLSSFEQGIYPFQKVMFVLPCLEANNIIP